MLYKGYITKLARRKAHPFFSALVLSLLVVSAFTTVLATLHAEAKTTLHKWGIFATHVNIIPTVTKGGYLQYEFTEDHKQYKIWGRVTFSPYSSYNHIIVMMKEQNELPKIQTYQI